MVLDLFGFRLFVVRSKARRPRAWTAHGQDVSSVRWRDERGRYFTPTYSKIGRSDHLPRRIAATRVFYSRWPLTTDPQTAAFAVLLVAIVAFMAVETIIS